MELSFDIGQGLVKGEWLGASLLADPPPHLFSDLSHPPARFAFASIKCDLHSETARPLQIPVTRDRARGTSKQASDSNKCPRLELVENLTCEFLCTKMVLHDSLGNEKVSAV